MLLNKHQTQFLLGPFHVCSQCCASSVPLAGSDFLGTHKHMKYQESHLFSSVSLTSPFGSCKDAVPTALYFHPRYTWPLHFMHPPFDVPCSHGARVLAIKGASGPWTHTHTHTHTQRHLVPRPSPAQSITPARALSSTPTQPCMDLSLLPPTPKNDCSCSLHTNVTLGRYWDFGFFFSYPCNSKDGSSTFRLVAAQVEQRFQACSEHFLCASLARKADRVLFCAIK